MNNDKCAYSCNRQAVIKVVWNNGYNDKSFVCCNYHFISAYQRINRAPSLQLLEHRLIV